MGAETATILVTDLVGSTALRGQLGEERAEELRRLHDRLLSAAVEAHGGVVVKGLGDGVLATFRGAAEALAAAVAIQRAASAHSRRHPRLPLIVRVGVSSGDVVVEQGDVFGTPVIEACRLCSVADGGQILAADLVRLLSRGRGGHEFRSVGDLELKGISGTVHASEVVWGDDRHDHDRPPFPPPLQPTGPLDFVGRAGELETLTRLWKEAAAGQRRAALLGGEPGIGKTRLGSEVASRAYESGGVVLYGRCEEELGAPYQPFVEALGWFCEQIEAGEVASRLGRYGGELVRLVPELARLVPDLDPPLHSDPETEQYRLFEAVASWLAAAGEPDGLLLVVDDLHWAAKPTLLLLQHVLSVAQPAHVLIVATFRDTEIPSGHPLRSVLADLRRVAGIERLSLGGLAAGELVELVEAATGRDLGQQGEQLAAALRQGTEGNPFFVGEVLRHLAEARLFEPERDPGQVAVALDHLSLPESVREVIVRRLDRLPDPDRELLLVASVLGRDFDLTLLSAVGEVDQEAAIRRLEKAQAARLIEETGVSSYRFVHALVRSALYETLSATRRARLHLRAADALEQLPSPDVARLAHHLVAAAPLGLARRAARWALTAGDRALEVLASAEAAAWYRTGLELLEDDVATRCDVLTGLGEAQRRMGEPGYRETLLTAAGLARETGDAPRLVRAVLTNTRGMASIVGDVDDERLELIDAALAAVGPAPTVERAQLLGLLAQELSFAPDHQRRLRIADEAGALAAELGRPAVLAGVAVRRLMACFVPERVHALVDESQAAIAKADESGDLQLQVVARSFSAGLRLVLGDLSGARALTAAAVALADDAGQPTLRWIAGAAHAGPVDALGHHDEARELMERALQLGQQTGNPDALMWYGGQMCLRTLFEDQLDVATAISGQAITQFPRMAIWQGAHAVGLALGGRTEEVEGVLAGLPARLDDATQDWFWICALLFFGIALAHADDREATVAVYDRLLTYRDLHGSYIIGYVGPVEVALGALAGRLGRLDLAVDHHSRAAGTIDRIGAARARAMNGYYWAVALLARGSTGDRERAHQLLRETVAYCRDRGYAAYQRLAEHLLGGEPRGPSSSFSTGS